mgnify:CR=1 FL=1
MCNLNKGFIYIWALFAVALTGVLMAGIGQVWQTKLQREKEKELLFVGDQIRRAITSYYEGSAAGGAGSGGVKQFPESLEKLILDTRSPVKKRHLRKLYLDPMTNSLEWGLIPEPPPEKGSSGIAARPKPGIIGVYSLSKKIPIKAKNFPLDYAKFAEAETYKDWQFVYTPGGGGNASKSKKSSAKSSSSSKSSSPFAGAAESNSGNGAAPSSSPFSSGGSSAPAQPGSNPFAPK